jgi:hypothetical protein
MKNNLVIIPFSCVPLSGVFRKDKINFKRGDAFNLSDFGRRLSHPYTYIQFNEETLVLTFKSLIEPNLYRFIVEEFDLTDEN